MDSILYPPGPRGRLLLNSLLAMHRQQRRERQP